MNNRKLVIIAKFLVIYKNCGGKKRVSMGLTVSRKTAKNLAVRRKNERILTVSRKKMLTVKKSNHKIRSRDLLLSLMCYAFMCSGSENYNRNWKSRVESVYIICRVDVVARVDRRFDSSTILRLLLSFVLTGCDGCIESDSKSLSRWRREAYRKI